MFILGLFASSNAFLLQKFTEDLKISTLSPYDRFESPRLRAVLLQQDLKAGLIRILESKEVYVTLERITFEKEHMPRIVDGNFIWRSSFPDHAMLFKFCIPRSCIPLLLPNENFFELLMTGFGRTEHRIYCVEYSPFYEHPFLEKPYIYRILLAGLAGLVQGCKRLHGPDFNEKLLNKFIRAVFSNGVLLKVKELGSFKAGDTLDASNRMKLLRNNQNITDAVVLGEAMGHTFVLLVNERTCILPKGDAFMTDSSRSFLIEKSLNLCQLEIGLKKRIKDLTFTLPVGLLKTE